MCKGRDTQVRLEVAPHADLQRLVRRERDLWRKRQAAKRQRQRQKAARAEAREAAG